MVIKLAFWNMLGRTAWETFGESAPLTPVIWPGWMTVPREFSEYG